MDLDPKQLKEKILSLLQREREFFELRTKFERLGVWLTLAQSLPQALADAHFSVDEVYGRLRKIMLANLNFQRVLFWEVEGPSLRPLSPPGPSRRLGADALSAIEERRFGVVNDPKGGSDLALADEQGEFTRFAEVRLCSKQR
mgnify:CR=1 FL=1